VCFEGVSADRRNRIAAAFAGVVSTNAGTAAGRRSLGAGGCHFFSKFIAILTIGASFALMLHGV
jgi:hypothetical protein